MASKRCCGPAIRWLAFAAVIGLVGCCADERQSRQEITLEGSQRQWPGACGAQSGEYRVDGFNEAIRREIEKTTAEEQARPPERD